jgi:hypothetical protein
MCSTAAHAGTATEDMHGGVDRFNVGLDAAVCGSHTLLTPACASLNDTAYSGWDFDLASEAPLEQIELIEDALAPYRAVHRERCHDVAQQVLNSPSPPFRLDICHWQVITNSTLLAR